MENKSHALAAGLFTIVLTIALIFVGLWFGRDRSLRTPYDLVTRMSVAGLSNEATVRFRGVEVGKVSKIEFDSKHSGQIVVHIDVSPGTPITKSTSAQLAYKGVTGLAYVELDDDGSNPQILTSDAQNTAQIEIQPGLLDRISGKGQTILADIDESVKRLNSLLAPENQRLVTDAFMNIDAATARIAELVPRLEPALTRLPVAINDTGQAMQSVGRMATDYDRIAQRLQEREGVLEQLAKTLDRLDKVSESLGRDTVPRIDATVDELARAARSVSRTTDAIGERPQSLLFGAAPLIAGPGEPGFVIPVHSTIESSTLSH